MIDIEKMPGYQFREGFKGLKSVSEGKVFMKEFSPGMYPACYRHGAILLVDNGNDGKLWRCRELGCEEGCFIPKK